MLNSTPAASLAEEEEYPQADGRCREANDQRDTSNSTLVLENLGGGARAVIGA